MEIEKRNRRGKKVKVFLEDKIRYDGVFLDEDERFILIRDKFDNEVTISKNSIHSMEVLKDG